VVAENDVHTLKEPITSYDVYFEHEMNALSDNNTILLE